MKTITIDPLCIGSLQILLFFIYSISFLLSSYVSIASQLISGFFGLILIPGLLLNQCALSKSLQGFSFGIMTGLLVNVFGIQLLFILSIFVTWVIALSVWLWFLDTIFVLVILFTTRKTVTLVNGELVDLIGSRVLFVILVGIVIRIVLAVLAVGAIGPDATLYADYARHIIDGQFMSSVQNDGAVISITRDTQFIAHQGFVFLFAIGWLLLSPTVSGPVIVLIIIGSTLPMFSFSIAQRYFDTTAARWVAGVVALHPLFVFYSAVAYGPGISSLAVITMVIAVLLDKEHLNNRLLFFAGTMIGIVDSIWYANFYVLFVILIFSLFVPWRREIQKAVTFSLLLGMVFVARIFLNLLIFIGGAAAVILLLFLIHRLNLQMSVLHNYFFFGGMLGSLFICRWPFFLSMAPTLYSGPSVTICFFKSLLSLFSIPVSEHFLFFVGFYTIILFVILVFYVFWSKKKQSKLAPFFVASLVAVISTLLIFGFCVISGTFTSFLSRFNMPFLGRFLFFSIFHMSTVLTILACFTLWSKEYRSRSAPFYIASLVAAIGTFWVFSSFGKDVLLPIYLYSDSRFFLFIVLSSVIGSSAYFMGRTGPHYWSTILNGKKVQGGGILVLILVGFVPGYLAIPTGIDLVNIEGQYGWVGITDQIEIIGPDALVLADRAREFAWLTGLPTVTLRLTAKGLPVIDASTEIKALVDDFGATHVLFDDYTFARWKTMEYVYLDNLTIGEPVVLFTKDLANENIKGMVTTDALNSSILIEPTHYNRWVRLFQITTARFQNSMNISFLDEGWMAGNRGNISNASGICQLQIGENENYTFTEREQGFDLGLDLRSGFGILQFQEVSAKVVRVELLNSNGTLLRYAEPISAGKYFFAFGNVEIGDIRIVIEGAEGGYVLVNGIRIWTYSVS